MKTTIIRLMDKLQATRLRLLQLLYDATGGNTRKWADLKELAKGIGITGDDLDKGHQYLLDEGLIQYYGSGYTSMITHQGIVAIEEAHATPSKRTRYFPPVDELDISNGTKEKL